ncbi:MAG: hypothetical protein AVDCRST_MAG19-2923 [uncultured Thermomicrobiales bacterium]|uniref:Uncharacterized protein n=1 Tax=uncultured Thermomicrobiales bacterium TaxID=1645740 RepID=A0A6J4VFM6_9BACT|nr:MAG: hypothetical protein AVDCRST_MAG19-2923 [uncultured Thermomicrobiales bacterium]
MRRLLVPDRAQRRERGGRQARRRERVPVQTRQPRAVERQRGPLQPKQEAERLLPVRVPLLPDPCRRSRQGRAAREGRHSGHHAAAGGRPPPLHPGPDRRVPLGPRHRLLPSGCGGSPRRGRPLSWAAGPGAKGTARTPSDGPGVGCGGGVEFPLL